MENVQLKIAFVGLTYDTIICVGATLFSIVLANECDLSRAVKFIFMKGYPSMSDQTKKSSQENKSTLISRNITVLGKRTSVRLEPEMWTSLREIAKRENCKIHDLCSLIQIRKNPNSSLTAAIRVFLMLYYRAAATDDGHKRAGHGSFMNMLHRARITYEMLFPLKADNKPAKNSPYCMDDVISIQNDNIVASHTGI